MPSVSEFVDKVLLSIYTTVYDALYQSVEKSLLGLFDSLNDEMSKAAKEITKGPKLWNGSAYETVQGIAENVCIPIAAIFITVIFCWELIHFVQESNNMNSMKPEKLILVLMKFALCLFVCGYSFKLIMGFCDLGTWAARNLRQQAASSITIEMVPTMEELGVPPDDYTFSGVMTLAGYKLILVIATAAILICGVVVYIRVMIWFMEYLMYASTAPIPYSTWMNKEWSQMGMNYTRKMLAKSFEGFFMLLLFAIYGGVLGGLSSGDFKQNLVMIIGCGFGLAVMMFKAGPISASIFNAH